LAAVEDLLEGVAGVKTLRKGMLNKLKSASLEDKRFVLQCLRARVIVDGYGVKEVSVGASPDTDSGVKRSVVCSTPQEYRFSLGVRGPMFGPFWLGAQPAKGITVGLSLSDIPSGM